jgi:hypothetical protein
LPSPLSFRARSSVFCSGIVVHLVRNHVVSRSVWIRCTLTASERCVHVDGAVRHELSWVLDVNDDCGTSAARNKETSSSEIDCDDARAALD